MEPQLLIASLYEHSPTRTTGQHDIISEKGEAVGFDTAGVIITIMAMIGIMIAMAMMGHSEEPRTTDSLPHFLMSTR